MKTHNKFSALEMYGTVYGCTGGVRVEKHTYLYDIFGFVQGVRVYPPFQNFSIEKKIHKAFYEILKLCFFSNYTIYIYSTCTTRT